MKQFRAKRKIRGRTALSTGLLAVAAGLAALANTAASASVVAHASGPAVTLNGAGSTFDQPFFTRAFYVYNQKHPNITVNYASIGSGGGEQQFESGTVNFGATDVPMLAADLTKVPASAGPVVQVPVDLGGEGIAYNLSGVSGQLDITPSVLAGIYLGTIKTWNDPALTSLNPKANLPNMPITVVHRADSSGTSYIFTNYLADVSPTWASQYGVSKSPAWPVGLGGQGNEGVAGLVTSTPGTIGYVEIAYVLTAHMKVFAVQNAKGKFIVPSKKSIADEAALHPHVSATNFSITDLGGTSKLADAAYPISGYSWAVILQDQTNQTTGSALVDLLYWLSQDKGGQGAAAALNYVPLPKPLEALATSELASVKGPNGKKLLPTGAALASLLAK